MASSYLISSGSATISLGSDSDTFVAAQLVGDSATNGDVIIKLQQSSDGVNFFDLSNTTKTILSGGSSVLVESFDYTLNELFLNIDVGTATLGTIDILVSTKKKVDNQLPKVYDTTVFNEQLVALRTSQMNYKPTWGATTYRYEVTETGTGASAAETNGEFRLQTGTTTTNIASLETNQRGQYQAGTMGQVGIGIRIPTAPTGTQYSKWGYSDFSESGFYFGYDVTGLFVAYLTGGSETKIYQTAWNNDVLDGTGISGLTLDTANGVISQIDFTWYGYGDIKFSFLLFNTTTLKTQKVTVHTIKINNSASIIDPNQPLMFEVGNGASSTTDFSLYIGGHQFSIIDGNSIPQQRLVSELLTNYTTATNTNWQPLIAFRKKATFNGRPNSVSVKLNQFLLAADGEAETRITTGGTTSNLTWATPTSQTSTETAIETKITTSGTALTTSSDGFPIDYGFVSGSNKAASSFVQELLNTLGADTEIILWARRLSGTGTIIIKHAHLTWIEEW